MKYVIKESNEFIDNYKTLQTASAEKKMEAICTDNLNRLFSISDDGKFYITYEKMKDSTGFKKENLLTAIEQINNTKKVSAKTFAVAQNIKDENFYLAVVATIDNKDHLFISKEEVIYAPKWVEIPFDDSSVSSDISINELYMSTLNSQRYLIADITLNNESSIIKRYFIDVNSSDNSKRWLPHPLPADFQDIYTSIMGRAYKEPIDGIYTLGSIGGKKQLIYTPSYNYFNPSIAPNPIKFLLDEGVDFISTLREESSGYTHLFSCGNGSLYFYPYGEQKNNAKSYKILDNEYLYNIKQLYSYDVNGKKMVWILTLNGNLFYCYSNAEGSDLTNASLWSDLVPVLENVQYAYAYPNSSNAVSNYLSYGYDSIITIGKESPINSLWTTQQVNLSSLNGDVVKFTSYATRITVTDDKNIPVPKKTVILKATDYCNVYINDKYYSFKEEPLHVLTDERGVVKIVQQASSTISANFNVTVNDNDSTSVSIDVSPQTKQLNKLIELNTLDKLKNATTGSGKKLIPDDVPDENIQAIANTMDVFAAMSSSMPENGETIKDDYNKAKSSAASSNKIFVLRVDGDKISSYKGSDAVKSLSPKYLQFNSYKTGFIDDFIYAAGEVINFMKNTFSKFFDIIISVADDIWTVAISIGEHIYSFVVKCINEVIACVEIIFNFIKVTIEKIFDYLRFLFEWDSISRVKDVMKKCVMLTFPSLKDNINSLNKDINDVLNNLINKASEIAGLDNVKGLSTTSFTDINTEFSDKEKNDVTGMYLADYLFDNYSSIDIHNNITKYLSNDSNLNDAVKRVIDAVAKEGHIIKDLELDLKDNIFTNKFSEYDILTILKKFTAIASKAALASCSNIVTAVLDLTCILIDSISSCLSEPIIIPVLSDILNDLLGIQPFSLLDILCLIPAVGSTELYKLLTNEEPIDDETYKYFMSIESFNELHNRKLLKGSSDILPSKGEKNMYIIFHISSGIIQAINEGLSLYKTVSKNENYILNGILATLDIINMGLLIGSSFLFSPILMESGTFMDVMYWIVWCIIGIRILVAGIDVLTVWRKKNSTNKFLSFLPVLSKIQDVILGLIAIIDALSQVVFICYFIHSYRNNDDIYENKEGLILSLLILDCASSLAGDLTDCCTIILDFVEDPTATTVLAVIHGLTGFGAALLQVIVGFVGIGLDTDDNKNKISDSPINLTPLLNF